MTKGLRLLAANERGNAVVELGFILPIFFTLVAGTVDIARAYSAKLDLEQAAQRSVEWVQVRDFKTSDVDTIKSDTASAAGVSTSAVTVDYWLECDGVRTSWDSACTATQTLARYLSVEVTKNFTPQFTTTFFNGISSGGTVPLKAKAGIRLQ
jgi:Flp pilus assembly protein TadG